MVVILGVSLMPPEWLRRAAFLGGLLALVGMAVTLFGGIQQGGASLGSCFRFPCSLPNSSSPVLLWQWLGVCPANTRFNFKADVAFLIYDRRAFAVAA